MKIKETIKKVAKDEYTKRMVIALGEGLIMGLTAALAVNVLIDYKIKG